MNFKNLLLLLIVFAVCSSLSADWFDRPTMQNIDSWNPSAEMDKMHQRMNQMVGKFYSKHYKNSNKKVSELQGKQEPEITIEEQDRQYIYRVGVEDFDQENINISAYDQILKIAGQQIQSEEYAAQDAGAALKSFYRKKKNALRAIPLPQNANIDALTTTLTNNILSIRLPKLGYNTFDE